MCPLEVQEGETGRAAICNESEMLAAETDGPR